MMAQMHRNTLSASQLLKICPISSVARPDLQMVLHNKKQGTYVCALTILKTKLNEILPTLEEEPKMTKEQEKMTPSQDEDALLQILNGLYKVLST
ncbi:hypothetical protein DSO57_1009275 [Entomophthora muscae]|uniref:Uncharacterized protein n=1 Tax=Entomophthora muscae TaxID=34485 RepID=A0ACC2UT47_9FUNG|nr:hypothetical protein DSO57_1009275 [Entomophthora muscae]